MKGVQNDDYTKSYSKLHTIGHINLLFRVFGDKYFFNNYLFFEYKDCSKIGNFFGKNICFVYYLRKFSRVIATLRKNRYIIYICIS